VDLCIVFGNFALKLGGHMHFGSSNLEIAMDDIRGHFVDLFVYGDEF
jgi:hypothetical protein